MELCTHDTLQPLPLPFWADLPLGLILIRQKALVGQLPGDHKVYKITKIVVIPLSEDEPQDLELEVINADCFVHMFSMLDLIKLGIEDKSSNNELMYINHYISSRVALTFKQLFLVIILVGRH